MKVKFIVFILFLFIFINISQVFASEKYYNPFLAGTLSWYSAGLGQFYTDDYLKGAIFFLIDSSLIFLAINSIADINLTIDEKFGVNFNIQLKKEKDIEYNSLSATFFFASYIIFHFYNVFDAVLVAVNKNSNISFNYNFKDNSLDLAYRHNLF